MTTKVIIILVVTAVIAQVVAQRFIDSEAFQQWETKS